MSERMPGQPRRFPPAVFRGAWCKPGVRAEFAQQPVRLDLQQIPGIRFHRLFERPIQQPHIADIERISGDGNDRLFLDSGIRILGDIRLRQTITARPRDNAP